MPDSDEGYPILCVYVCMRAKERERVIFGVVSRTSPFVPSVLPFNNKAFLAFTKHSKHSKPKARRKRTHSQKAKKKKKEERREERETVKGCRTRQTTLLPPGWDGAVSDSAVGTPAM